MVNFHKHNADHHLQLQKIQTRHPNKLAVSPPLSPPTFHHGYRFSSVPPLPYQIYKLVPLTRTTPLD